MTAYSPLTPKEKATLAKPGSFRRERISDFQPNFDLVRSSYPLHWLQAAETIIDASKDSMFKASRAVTLQRASIRYAMQEYRCGAIFAFVRFRPDAAAASKCGQIPPNCANPHGLYELLREQAQKLAGSTDCIWIGGVWPTDAGLEIVALSQNKPKWSMQLLRRTLEFMAKLDDQWALRSGSHLRFDLSLGSTYLDIDGSPQLIEARNTDLENLRQLKPHVVVAEMGGHSSSKAGALSKRKRRGEFGHLFNCTISNFLVVVETSISSGDALALEKVSWLKRDENYDGRLFEIIKFPPPEIRAAVTSSTAAISRCRVVAIDIDVVSSSNANENAPIAFAVYRNLLRNRLSEFSIDGVYSGVWAGDGLKIIAVLPPNEYERCRLVRSLNERLIRFVWNHNLVDDNWGLRIGVAYVKGDVDLTKVILGKRWDNPAVDALSCRSTIRAESIQRERCRTVMSTPPEAPHAHVALVLNSGFQSLLKRAEELDVGDPTLTEGFGRTRPGYERLGGKLMWMYKLFSEEEVAEILAADDNNSGVSPATRISWERGQRNRVG